MVMHCISESWASTYVCPLYLPRQDGLAARSWSWTLWTLDHRTRECALAWLEFVCSLWLCFNSYDCAAGILGCSSLNQIWIIESLNITSTLWMWQEIISVSVWLNKNTWQDSQLYIYISGFWSPNFDLIFNIKVDTKLSRGDLCVGG